MRFAFQYKLFPAAARKSGSYNTDYFYICFTFFLQMYNLFNKANKSICCRNEILTSIADFFSTLLFS